jgi:hypothetical protein
LNYGDSARLRSGFSPPGVFTDTLVRHGVTLLIVSE